MSALGARATTEINSNKNLWPYETYPLLGKTYNTCIDQMYVVCNMVTRTREKNEAERGIAMSGLQLHVKMVKEDLVDKLTLFKNLEEMEKVAMWISEEDHSRQRKQ